MTIRNLPELKLPRVSANVTFEIPQKAMTNWDRGVTALASENTITIFDAIGNYYDSGFTVARMSAALRSVGDKPVTVQINSPGGIYDDGLAIFNLLRAHPARVTTQIIGMAASAASIVAMAGDDIQIGKAAHFMIHNTQSIAIGDRRTMMAAHDAMTIFDESAALLYADRTGIPVSDIRQMMDDETYMGGEKAVELGFANQLLPADPGRIDVAADRPLAFQVEDALQQQGWPRAKCRRALKELRGMPGAVSNVMPSADDDDQDPLDLNSLRIAAARVSLLRAS